MVKKLKFFFHPLRKFKSLILVVLARLACKIKESDVTRRAGRNSRSGKPASGFGWSSTVGDGFMTLRQLRWRSTTLFTWVAIKAEEHSERTLATICLNIDPTFYSPIQNAATVKKAWAS